MVSFVSETVRTGTTESRGDRPSSTVYGSSTPKRSEEGTLSSPHSVFYWSSEFWTEKEHAWNVPI